MRTLCLFMGLALLGCDERDNPTYAGEAYPIGPYGWAEGDTLPNWTFLDAEGSEVSMQLIRSTTTATTLVLLPSAPWMESSTSMLRRAATLHAEGREDVLILSAVFEDANARAAEVTDALAWQTTYDVPWEVVAEPLGQFRLAWRDDMRAAVLIDLTTMKRLDPDRRPGIRDVLWP